MIDLRLIRVESCEKSKKYSNFKNAIFGRKNWVRTTKFFLRAGEYVLKICTKWH